MQKPFTMVLPVEQEREYVKPFTCEIDGVMLEKPFTIHEQVEIYDLEQNNNVNQAVMLHQEEVNKEEKRLDFTDCANYIITPMVRTVYINRKGEEIQEKEKIHCKIWIAGKDFGDFEVLTSEIHNITKIIGKRYSSAMMNYTISHVEKMIESAFRYKTYKLDTIFCFVEHGWQNIDGKMQYLNDCVCAGMFRRVESGVKLPRYNYKQEQLKNVFFSAMSLYKDMKSISTMVLFSLLGVTYRLFVEAGHTPHFLLFLNGKTGSMKTTIGKILFMQLSDDAHRDYPRRIDTDTVVSFERAIVTKGRDTITLIDDYSPAKTAQKKAELQKKLEAIIRMVGDGSTKSRSNQSLDDVQGEGVQGGVVLTGELRGKGVSSNLRCLYCQMYREQANVELVTWFQDNPYAYTTLIASFTDYLSENWDRIRQYIKTQFPVGRRTIINELKERRLIDSVVILHIIADILHNFLAIVCNVREQDALTIINNMKVGVVQNAIYSESVSVEENPAIEFIKTMDSLICQGDIYLCGKDEYMSKGESDGFVDDKYYYLVPQKVYEKVRRAFNAVNKYFSLDLSELISSLYEEKIIKSYSNGAGKKTYYARVSIGAGKKQSFIKISKEVFEAIVDDTFENGV